MRAFKNRRASRDMTWRVADSTGEDGARQFRSDFQAIAHAITDPDWHKTPKPHDIAIFPPFRTKDLPRRLPFGPLMRMARLLGLPALRYVFAVSADQGTDFYRLVIRPRLDKEFRRGNHYKRHDQEAKLVRFGNAVLERELFGEAKRSEAMEAAAIELGIVASARSHERYFHQFRMLCEQLGYIPSSNDWMGRPPRFALADLDGRSPDKSGK
jgi:hypothetical protein